MIPNAELLFRYLLLLNSPGRWEKHINLVTIRHYLPTLSAYIKCLQSTWTPKYVLCGHLTYP